MRDLPQAFAVSGDREHGAPAVLGIEVRRNAIGPLLPGAVADAVATTIAMALSASAMANGTLMCNVLDDMILLGLTDEHC